MVLLKQHPLNISFTYPDSSVSNAFWLLTSYVPLPCRFKSHSTPVKILIIEKIINGSCIGMYQWFDCLLSGKKGGMLPLASISSKYT